MNKLVDALARFSGKYLQKYRHDLPRSALKALMNFSQCRTQVFGKFTNACTDCGTLEEVHGACRNRACPKCNSLGTSEWIRKAKARLPNTAYYHMVFTVPSELHPVALRNRKVFFEKLMATVGETLSAFSASGKWLHGQTGFITFLHTWDSQLRFHPHVHVLAMGGYLDEKGEWVEVMRKELFPARALSCRFKTMFLKSLRESLQENIPSSFWTLPWVVYMKKTLPGTQSVIEYLGRYVKKIGLGASRLLRVDKHGVVLKYRHRLNKQEQEWRALPLPGEEFMRRYLLHVLPPGFVRIRYLGLLHSHWASVLEKVREKVKGEAEEKAMDPPVKVCRECRGKMTEVAREVPVFFGRRRRRGGNSIYTREGKRSAGMKDGTSPYNKRIEPSVGGRHVFRVRESRAGTPPAAGLPPSASGPSSRFIRALVRREARYDWHGESPCMERSSNPPLPSVAPKRVTVR